MEDLEKIIASLIQDKVKESLAKSGKFSFPEKKKEPAAPKKVEQKKEVVTEALVATPSSFVIKTEKLSRASKESHENLYKKYIESFNKVSSELDAVNKHDAGSYASVYRSLKMDECYNLNAVKLHELYFNNISDLASEVAVDSLPYIKFSRDFGTFENWQFDFMACAMSSREGWAITVYDPYKSTYMNICVDGHTVGLPVGAIPVLVIDMWSHSFFKDYEIDKKSYLISMMREINWDVIEARVALAEKSDLNALYHIKPNYSDESNKLLSNAQVSVNVPIRNATTANGSQVPTTTPPAPETINNKGLIK